MASTVAFAGTIPANYDKYLGPLLFEPYAEDLLKRVFNRLSGDILEIACGTGRVTRVLANALNDKGSLTATDLNPDMIEVGKQKVKDSRIKWRVEDAQSLSFDDSSFDTVVCQYGVMFFPDKLKAFREVNRVLKNGGMFLFNAWDRIQNIPIVGIMDKVLKEELKNDAPEFLEKGPYSFADTELMKELMQQAGFKDIKIEMVELMNHYDSADQIAKGFFEGSPLASFLDGKEEGVKNKIRERITEEIVETFGESSDEVLLRAWVCEGIKN